LEQSTSPNEIRHTNEFAGVAIFGCAFMMYDVSFALEQLKVWVARTHALL